MEQRKRPLTAWYLIDVVALLVVLQLLLTTNTPETLSYSDFKTLLQAHKVNDLTIGDSTIEGTVDTAGIANLLTPKAVAALDAAKVHYEGAADSH